MVVNPPASGGPVEQYIVTLCLQPGGTPCVTENSTTTSCPFTGLTPGATYEASAVAIVAGRSLPASNTLPLVMPDAGAITLVTAVDTSSTTGSASAVPPPSTPITLYTFTVTPLDGGDPLTFNSTTRDVDFTGLTPATQYEVVVVGTKPDGTTTPPSNTLAFVTPAAG